MDTKTYVIDLQEKGDIEDIRWVQKAVCGETDMRPALTAIHIREDMVEAVDGWRMHRVARSIEPLAVGEELLHFDKTVLKRAGRYVADTLDVEAEYPDTDAVIPSEEPQAIFFINADLLTDALAMPTEDPRILTVSVFGGPNGSRVSIEDFERKHYALVMGADRSSHRESRELAYDKKRAERDMAVGRWLRENKPDAYGHAEQNACGGLYWEQVIDDWRKKEDE